MQSHIAHIVKPHEPTLKPKLCQRACKARPREELDDIIFDELGLTQVERNEVYWSVAELVKQRLDKAAIR
ncbi:MAG: hypothetical protein A2X08_15670 [Bacteroidetes bacterium GWA2_32_17]|nr:MAG: hypothetical protein A2X08_15670 [Bacteroidetes bacterium GWA2_32_17]